MSTGDHGVLGDMESASKKVLAIIFSFQSLMWESKSQSKQALAFSTEIPETIINLPLSLRRKPNGRAL